MLELSRFTVGNPRHPPLIFLHGFLGVKEDWEWMLRFFEERFYCVAFDLPGHGSSPHADEILPVLKNAIKQATSTKPVCIGYSMGGRLAMQLQEDARAIVAISSHPGLTTEAEKEVRRTIDDMWCEKLLHLPFDAFFAEWYAQPIFQTLPRNPTLLQTLVKRRMEQNPQHLAYVMRHLSLS